MIILITILTILTNHIYMHLGMKIVTNLMTLIAIHSFIHPFIMILIHPSIHYIHPTCPSDDDVKLNS